MPVLSLGRPPSRELLLRALAAPGAAAFEGWSDDRAWRVYLPWPEELRELPWDRARDWQQFVASLDNDPNDEALPGSPFATGWIGFVAYEAGALVLDAPSRTATPAEPAAWFARHTSGIAVHGDEAFLYAAADDIEARRDALRRLVDSPRGSSRSAAAEIDDSMPHGEFALAVESIRDRIAAGDVYQINLTRAFTARVTVDAADLYVRMTGDAPPRCAAFLRGDGWAIASASPEVLLHYDRGAGTADSRPIKGTVRRDGDDAGEIAALSASAKDDSEHLMIVDLIRNDLGTVAPAGCVDVPEYKSIITLPYVYHLESTVRATGLAGRGVAEVLGALFPGGSITGAPKRAAVHAIRELEPVPRGVYTGAIGFIDDRGLAEFNVAIRTAVVTPEAVRYHAGGGIVWDSSPAAEDAESIAKAIPFLRAIGANA